MIKNKFLCAALSCLLAAGSLSACGQKEAAPAADSVSAQSDSSFDESGSAVNIVTTIFPQYDWVREIVKDSPQNIETTLLLCDGVDLHSYQPTAEDIMKIAKCDIFIYVGGESDSWVEDALTEDTGRDMTVVNLIDVLGDSAKEEVIDFGMESEDEEESEGGEEKEYDEHVWLSLKNAAILCDAIEKAIAEKDPKNADIYSANLASYKEKISDLDKKYEKAVSGGATDTLLFGDRFPFLYMAEDYGLGYYAAFAGCSSETEASFETIVYLAGKVNELGLRSICTLENSDQKIAQTIRDNTETKDQEILAFDSLQSIKSADIENGVTYLSLMENNLDVLKKALG
ncbi:MAG: zinc ABC transporter substrate-binding protein [Lachnospiraceae bacterium]|jgi:zinc transport system substrate-binding protein|nr:zinc ABC transporter substrate-binding protein [Lachnospiraceae bacterium]